MQTYLAHKIQVQGFKDVAETIKTVEKIAASSIHRLRQHSDQLTAYVVAVEEMLARLLAHYSSPRHPLLREKPGGSKALIILTGDKGLVGGLWHTLIGALKKNYSPDRPVIAVGAKGRRYLWEEGIALLKFFPELSKRPVPSDSASSAAGGLPSAERLKKITGYVFDEFKKGSFSRVDILYPQFISLAEQKPALLPFLPFAFNAFQERASRGPDASRTLGLPIFEPARKIIFNRLLREYIGVFFYRIVVETKLSELAARTVAMEHAAVKTEAIIKKLTLAYAKERRRILTRKQLESFTARALTQTR